MGQTAAGGGVDEADAQLPGCFVGRGEMNGGALCAVRYQCVVDGEFVPALEDDVYAGFDAQRLPGRYVDVAFN